MAYALIANGSTGGEAGCSLVDQPVMPPIGCPDVVDMRGDLHGHSIGDDPVVCEEWKAPAMRLLDLCLIRCRAPGASRRYGWVCRIGPEALLEVLKDPVPVRNLYLSHRIAPRGATSMAATPRPYRATSRSPCLLRSTPESSVRFEMTCSTTSSVAAVSGSSYLTSMWSPLVSRTRNTTSAMVTDPRGRAASRRTMR
jgi:hypothetical protein